MHQLLPWCNQLMVVLGCMLLVGFKGANKDSCEELTELEELAIGEKGSEGRLEMEVVIAWEDS